MSVTRMKIPAWAGDRLVAMDKIEVHRQGLRHPAVSVFVLAGDQVLLQRRAETKYHTPGLWANACCTHPNWGEAADTCARRRLAEELGISGLDLTRMGEVEYRADVGGGMVEHECVTIFTAEALPGLQVQPDPAEVADWRWMARDALLADVLTQPAIYTPWLRIYLAQHRGMIFGGLAPAPARG